MLSEINAFLKRNSNIFGNDALNQTPNTRKREITTFLELLRTFLELFRTFSELFFELFFELF
jgi:hypothetical protein